jgi:hypothetical protein
MSNATLIAHQSSLVEAHVIPDIPPLAWLVTLAGLEPTLLCGPEAEIFPDGCVEGCWAGDFDAHGFDAAPHMFGSGFELARGKMLFVTPSHTLDALYALRRGGRFTVSNSLAFLARFCGLSCRSTTVSGGASSRSRRASSRAMRKFGG